MADKFDLKLIIFKYILITPFLFIVSIFDFIIGLVVPYKYEDPELPDKNAKLTELTDKKNPYSPYRSTLASDLVQLHDPNTNIYEEFTKCVKAYW